MPTSAPGAFALQARQHDDVKAVLGRTGTPTVVGVDPKVALGRSYRSLGFV